MFSFRLYAVLVAALLSGSLALAGEEGHPWQTPSSQQPAAEPAPPPPPPAAPLPPLPKTLAEPPPAREPEPAKEAPPVTRRVKETTREYDEAVPTAKVTTVTTTRDVAFATDPAPVQTQTIAATQIALYQPGPIGAFLGRVGTRLSMFGQPYYRLAPAPQPVLQQTAFIYQAPAPQLRFATAPTTIVTQPVPQTVTPIYAAPKKCWPFH